jgi:hypothetical protein
MTGTPISRRKLAHYRTTLRLGLAAEAAPALTAELTRLLRMLRAWP